LRTVPGVGWETQRTTALPEVPARGGRHRRRRRLSGLATVIVLLTIGVTGAMLSPVLVGWNGPLVPRQAYASSAATPPEQPTPTLAAPIPPTTQAAPTSAAPPATSAAPDPGPKNTDTYALADVEDTVLTITNTERKKAGCGALKKNTKLRKAARDHSIDMAQNNYFDHTGLDKSSPGQRIQAAGYQSNGWAENIAYGYRTPQAVMTAWMESAGHRRNILDCALKDLGVGAARADNGTMYWTQDFGRG
jgi:uncharacterized protein YkwD